MVELRTFTILDKLQPQLASFLATISQGYLPIENQASLYIEVAPGMAIQKVTDIALKSTDVRPGMQIVERAFGVLEVHSDSMGMVQQAASAILDHLHLQVNQRLKPRIMSSQVITGIDPYHCQLINRMRHGEMIYEGQTLYILETHPAGYALIAANEAEKAAPIKLLEVRAVGAFGRLYLGGEESAIEEAVKAIMNTLNSLDGRPNEDKRG
jgi:ethanolamine utilization microcompartment shell protein EutS